MDPAPRGIEIERILNHNLPSKYPVIDRFSNGFATSIKSLDLNPKSHQSISKLNSVVKSYINKVSSFNGRNWAGRNIRGSEITGRGLDLAVPSNASPAQYKALQDLVKYGRELGIKVKIIRI